MSVYSFSHDTYCGQSTSNTTEAEIHANLVYQLVESCKAAMVAWKPSISS